MTEVLLVFAPLVLYFEVLKDENAPWLLPVTHLLTLGVTLQLKEPAGTNTMLRESAHSDTMKARENAQSHKWAIPSVMAPLTEPR